MNILPTHTNQTQADTAQARTQILVPIDFSDNSIAALDYAVAIAAKTGAEVTLYHGFYVMTEVQFATIDPSYLNMQINNQELYWNERLESLKEKLADKTYADGSPLSVKTLVKMGLVADDIGEMVHRGEYQLVVMGTKGASGLERIILGSIAGAVAEQVTCPILIIPQQVTYQGLHNIVYATNFDRADTAVIDGLLEFCKLFDSKLTCLHITTNSKQIESDQLLIDELKNTYWHVSEAQIAFVLQTADSAMEGIRQYVQAHKPDMLVLLNQKRSFIERIFDPSVSKAFTYTANIPVMILKK
ncbi:MAG: universal stress protein [Cytophagales bacterium]|nr:universal stress protein [Bernardetiaceae bacterium]MDW8204060.1 universal stress protein [Cytophagales bacterium]